MRKLLFIFLLSSNIGIVSLSQVNGFLPCDPNREKIKFTGVAPWAIDGQISDWQTILGPSTGNVLFPFITPFASVGNWSMDGTFNFSYEDDLDHPTAQRDLRFFATTYDDYNFYFYFRRIENSNAQNTFLYFIDVNADGFMDAGEPVIKANFNSNNISNISLCKYIPDLRTDYVAGKGNYMVFPLSTPVLQRESADGYTMKGSVEEIFTSSSIPAQNSLTANEVFKAAVTENGFGVEFSVPWKFVKNWLTNTIPLHPGFIFSYHASLMNGAGQYLPNKVEDNAGGCCGGVAVSGNLEFVHENTTVTTLVQGESYRFQLKIKNPTNTTEGIRLEELEFSQIQLLPGFPLEPAGFHVTMHPDYNCNGVIDPDENAVTFQGHEGTRLGQRILIFNDVNRSPYLIVAPFESICFLVDITLPADHSVTSTHLDFGFDKTFIGLPTKICFIGGSGGGKPINPVGYDLEINQTLERISVSDKVNENQEGKIKVYPNPNNGEVTIIIPAKVGTIDMVLLDVNGRQVQYWHKVTSSVVKIKNLSKGYYILKVMPTNNTQGMVKKILVQ